MLLTEEFKNKSQFFSYLNDAYKNREIPSLHCFVLIPRPDFNIDELTKASYNRGLKCRITKKMDDFYSIGIGIKTREQIGILIDFNYCWLFFSDGPTQDVKGVVESFVKQLFPLISLSNLPSKSMLDFINDIKQNYDKIWVTEGTLCKKGETIRNWKKDPLIFSVRELHKEAKIEKAKWSGLSLKIFLGEKEHIKVRIYEKGLITFYHGNFSDFYENILLTFANKSLEFSNFLKNKERKRYDDNIIINPVKYQFKKEILISELDIIKEKILSKYVGGVTSYGNPLLMMQFTDSTDGSSYDLYAYDDTIEIVPLNKASSASFTNLFSIITDNLPLGEIIGG